MDHLFSFKVVRMIHMLVLEMVQMGHVLVSAAISKHVPPCCMPSVTIPCITTVSVVRSAESRLRIPNVCFAAAPTVHVANNIMHRPRRENRRKSELEDAWVPN